MDKNKILVLIPTKEITSNLVSFVKDLHANHFTNVLICTTESADKNEDYEMLIADDQVETLTYEEGSNHLKSRVERVLDRYGDNQATIVADAAGQYSVRDIEMVTNAFAAAPDDIFLGVRQLKRDSDAKRPSMGDRLIEFIFNQLEQKISTESETSLRVISNKNIHAIYEAIEADEEHSTNPLVIAKKLEIPIKSVPIYTDAVEVEDRSYSSRIVGLIKVYKTFFKFTASSLFSTVVDLAIFTAFIYILRSTFPTGYIMVSTIIARIVSIIVNYTINNKLVFKRKKQKRGAFIRYITLAIVEMFASGSIVTFLVENFIRFETLTKVLVDGSLFFVGYLIQKKFVFTDDD